MIQKFLLSVSFSVLILFSLKGQQTNTRKYEFQYGIGVVNFMGDIASPSDANQMLWMHFFNTISPTVNVGLRYNIKKKHFISSCLYIGELYAKDPYGNSKYYYDRGLKFDSFFTEFSARYEYQVFKEKAKRTVYTQLGETPLKNFSLPTYVFIGVGATFNVGIYSEVLDKTVNRENFVNIAPVIPMGFGVKLRLNRTTYLNIEAGARIALSDGIDNAKGKNDDRFGPWIDQYQFLSLNLIHKLKAKPNGFPKFKFK